MAHRCSLWGLIRRKRFDQIADPAQATPPMSSDLESINLALRAELEQLKADVISSDTQCAHLHLELAVAQKDLEKSKASHKKVTNACTALKDRIAALELEKKTADEELVREMLEHEQIQLEAAQSASLRTALLAELQIARGSELARVRELDLSDPAAHVSFSKRLADCLTCNVCFDLFADPVTLPCGHSGCARCFERCTDEYRRCILCTTAISDSWSTAKGRNYTLRDIVEVVKKAGAVRLEA